MDQPGPSGLRRLLDAHKKLTQEEALHMLMNVPDKELYSSEDEWWEESDLEEDCQSEVYEVDHQENIPSNKKIKMDLVEKLLTEWGFESLIDVFKMHEIDEEALNLLDRDSMRNLIPQIGMLLKFEKKLSEYKLEKDKNVNDWMPPKKERNGDDAPAIIRENETVIARPSETNAPKSSVNEIVQENFKGLWEKLHSGQSVSYLEKLKLSRLLVKHCLVKNAGAYPSTQEKEDLAQEIVTTFPSLKSLDGTGYEQWFCKGLKKKNGKVIPNRGYIEEHLRNWRQRLCNTDKIKYGIKIKNADSTVTNDFEFNSECLQKQQWFKENSALTNSVSQYMSDTCVERHIILADPSIVQLSEAWPKHLNPVSKKIKMDPVAKLLTEWGFQSLIEVFLSHEIDEEALDLLDRDSMRNLIPQLGILLKFEKKFNEYKLEKDKNVNDEMPPKSEKSDVDAPALIVENKMVIATPTVTNAPKRSVNQIVQENLKSLWDKLQLGESISYLEKLKLSRLLVKHCLVRTAGAYPSTQDKEDLALEIITTFPGLKSLGGTGYEQWFCKSVKDKTGKVTPNRGYIEEHLRNWRQRLCTTDKMKYGVITKKTDVKITNEFEFTSECLRKQQWLKENSAPANIVSQYMSETCLERNRHIILTNPSIMQLSETWPKLLNPEMIDQDFSILYSRQESESFCRGFGLFSHSILLQAKNCGRSAAEKYALSLLSELTDLSISGISISTAVNNSALLLLPYLLPQGIVNGRKKFRPTLEQTKEHFIHELPVGSNIENIINTRAEEDKTFTQPFILITGNKLKPAEIFVVIQKGSIRADSLLKAVDICFKMHFIYNVEYSNLCSNVWKFFNTTFYKIGENKGSSFSAPSCVKELRSRLLV